MTEKSALLDLIEKTRDIKMTPEQEREQARSFAYGNVHFENPDVTREMVDAAEEKIWNETAAGPRNP